MFPSSGAAASTAGSPLGSTRRAFACRTCRGEQLAREIHGLDQLSSEHRDLVLDELTSKEAVKLEEIDPDDPRIASPRIRYRGFPPPRRSPARCFRSRRRASAGWWPTKRAQSRAASSPTRWAWVRRYRPSLCSSTQNPNAPRERLPAPSVERRSRARSVRAHARRGPHQRAPAVGRRDSRLHLADRFACWCTTRIANP